ncbi:MAG: response regulator [Bacteroidetes bacterium]|jgi:CheY-like chemotaxis protein|nr:response regulator [Bacteroidota bacterium]
MPYKVLIADDDEGQRKSHGFALEVATAIIEDEIAITETATSVETWAKIKAEQFHLIILDNDFKDTNLKGHLPGIALLQLAKKEGPNRGTPTFFCSADAYDTLKAMVEKYGGHYLPKVGYDIEKVAQLFADNLKKK